MAAQSLLAWFVEQLAFIAMYQVALVAVMLTGNILTALLGCAVFFSYELAVRFLIDELKTMFFASYCSADAKKLSDTLCRLLGLAESYLVQRRRTTVQL